MREIEIRHVKEIEVPIQNGATEPLRCMLDNDVRAVIKVFNNVQGNLTLVNEYVCYQLALALNIPMPLSGICLCDDKTIDAQNDLCDKNYGYGFYSTYIEKNTILKAGIMKHVQNIDIFYKVVIFDHLIYNKDRNTANLLVEYSKQGRRISVIDHTHVFKNETIWDEHCFKIGVDENDYLDTDIMRSNYDIYQMFIQTMSIEYSRLLETAEEVQQILTDKILDTAIFSVLDEWKVSERDLSALKQYLIYRRGHLQDMCRVIYDYIQTN